MLYRMNPNFPLFSLRSEIDRLFEDTLGGSGTTRRGWVPAVDVREGTQEYTFELELPGIEPDQVDVTADNGVLTVRGQKEQQSRKEGDEGRYHFVERSYGSFVRAFQLPQGVEEESITADFANGLLTIRVPKAQRPQPRKIEIGAGGADQRLRSGETGAEEAPRSNGTTRDEGKRSRLGEPGGSRTLAGAR